MNKPKAIFFDWDDTLVATWQVVRKALNTAITAMGGQAWTEEEAKSRVGPAARTLFTGLFGEDKWQEADRIYIKAYEDNIAAELRKHAHVDEILSALAAAEIPMFVVSSKRGPLLRKEAAHLGLEKYFRSLVGAGDAANDKPHRDTVALALRDSGIDAGADVWFLGDGFTDLLAAKNCGCTAVLIETKLPSSEKIAEHPPALRFKTHADLLAHIRAWQKPEKASRPAAP